MSQNIKKEVLNKPPFFLSYFITDPDEFGDTPAIFKKNLIDSLSHFEVDILCFRDKSSLNKEKLAQVCLDVGRTFQISKILINSDIELCQKLGFDGVHFNSLQFNQLKNLESSPLFKIISCHNDEDILLAKKYNANAITYSPIFFKENKGEPKGLRKLENIVSKYQQKTFFIIALGGIINHHNIQEVYKTGAKGFASIRYFKV